VIRPVRYIIPGAEFAEMPRNQTKSFCCGAGGARMWMEEKVGTRINLNRTTEAVEVADVAQLLLASVKRG
jgi:Fe-S oxidoreductase